MTTRKKPTRKKTTAAPTMPTVQDAALTFRISGGALDGQNVTLDLLLLRLTCEDLERQHSLSESSDGRPTVAFLRDLAAELGALGEFDCSPSVAYQIWHAATAAMVELKKNMHA